MINEQRIFVKLPQADLNIFALASILPNKYDAFEGDFILRQCQAIAQFVPVTLFVQKEVPQKQLPNGQAFVETVQHDNLNIIYSYASSDINTVFKINKYLQNVRNVFLPLHNQKPFTHIHAHIHWRAGLAAFMLNKQQQIPYILSEHLVYFNKVLYGKQSVAAYNFIKKSLTKAIFNKATCNIVVSNYLKKHVQDFAPKATLEVIANVVDTSLFYFNGKHKVGAPFVFVHAAGTSMPQKNIDKLLQGLAIAYAKNPNFIVKIYAAATAQLQDLIKQQQLDNCVHIMGMVSYSELGHALQNAHASIMYSRDETFSCVVAESLCCGTPVIGINITGSAELIDEHNGIKCDPYNPQSLADAIESMISNYSSYNLKVIAENASKKYRYDVVAKQIIALYR